MLIHVSILDLKYREVDFKIWLIYLPLVVFFIFYVHKIDLFLYSYSLGVSVFVLYMFYKLSLMGGADLMAILIIGLSNPSVYPLFFPTFSELGMEPLVVILYSSISVFLVSLYNLAKYFKYTKGMPFSKRIILALSAKRMKVKDFLNSSFLFPLTQVDDDGNVTLRSTFSIEEDDKEWKQKFRKLVEERRISEDSYIWVAWGVPVLPFMLIGYLLSLVIGFPFT
ncbi:peptidase A24 [Acidianus infernus]|uniref:Peptidase A24 n=1 Tax=Acidianus infernus TaxID=12915 RepID=A0A6A9QNK1_ACIIN|nr:A24 family peptidase C-terminal domain-containing protein [Acidianus infernus]MCY0883153.1 prepilin peptidase [Acidianus infernus]MUM64797.1 peptidase A24 [Acidianus infernus]